MDIYTQLSETRNQVKATPFSTDEKVLVLYTSHLQGLASLAATHQNDHDREWETGILVKEYLEYAPLMAENEASLNTLYVTSKTLADALVEHPRLKVQMLKFQQLILKRITPKDEKQLRYEEEIKRMLNAMNQNIHLADTGALDRIPQSDFFKTDPVEWTSAWENCIDAVNEEVEKEMGEACETMGISQYYWNIKTKVLKAHGIDWKSPAKMNPDIIFD